MGESSDAPELKMMVSEEEIRAERVPLAFRDYCAHMLIPLNKCRRKNCYLPFRCVDERHAYEKCQYDYYVRRMEEMQHKIREERVRAIEEKEAKAHAAARATIQQ